MKTASKIAIGVSLASGALLAAWLLTGTRKARTKKFIVEKAANLKKTTPKKVKKAAYSDSESLYV